MANGSNANIGFEKQIRNAARVLFLRGHIPAAGHRKEKMQKLQPQENVSRCTGRKMYREGNITIDILERI